LIFLIFFYDNRIMEGLTIQELAEKLGISERAVYQRLHTLKIEPLSRQAIYPAVALEAIREVSKGGRPRKKTEGENGQGA
jgi:predicted ArsR family transcriptional regulator